MHIHCACVCVCVRVVLGYHKLNLFYILLTMHHVMIPGE